EQGNFERAVADWCRAVELEPEDSWTRQMLAWLWATCRDARHRNGAKAVAQATKACELSKWEDADCLVALAAAHAECGQYEMAIRRQEEALKRATADQRPFFTHLLELYREGQPFRENR